MQGRLCAKLAVAANIDPFFRFREHDLSYLDVQDFLDEPLAEALLAHDFLKDEIIRKETLMK